MQKYEVIIYENPEYGTVNIAFIYDEGGKRYIAKHVELEFEELDYTKSQPNREATLVLPDYRAHELLRALAETLDKKDIKTDKDAKIQGTLEATRYHLEDLRKLLKINK